MHWRDTIKRVKSRIRQWRSDEILDLWAQVRGDADSSHWNRTKKSTSESLRKANIVRAKRAMGEGHYRKAIQSLSSAGLADPSSEAFDEMLAKHPQCPPPPEFF